jgi:hypothetical protein
MLLTWLCSFPLIIITFRQYVRSIRVSKRTSINMIRIINSRSGEFGIIDKSWRELGRNDKILWWCCVEYYSTDLPGIWSWLAGWGRLVLCGFVRWNGNAEHDAVELIVVVVWNIGNLLLLVFTIVTLRFIFSIINCIITIFIFLPFPE